uniref:F-box domain-containing protein n=1 Tax=Tetranychus urticae TaxID=32264 RepID=T1K962_TETUR
MFINELPDECLLTIFDYLNNFDDLANCYKVCIKWSHLIAERTRKVKYLMVSEFSKDPDYSSDLVYYQGLDLSTRYKTLLSTLFSNLPILHNPNIYNSDFIYIVIELLKKVIDFEKKEKELENETEDLEKLEQFFFLKRHLKSLKGIINCCDVV